MNTLRQPLQEVTHQAIHVLCREIGVVNTLRFIQQFTNGYGDYTKERETFLEKKPLETIIAEIKSNRKTVG